MKLVFILTLFFKSIHLLAFDSGKLRSEVLIHLGLTSFRTKQTLDTSRDNLGQIGYDTKFGYDLGDFRPFIKLDGYFVLKTIHSEVGLGSYWFKNNTELQLDIVRKREKFSNNSGSDFQGETVLFKARLIWSQSLYIIRNWQIKSLFGFGNISEGETKIFKLNRGEHYLVGVRFFQKNLEIKNDESVYEIFWQQDNIRSPALRQERNSFIFRAGKRF